MQGIIYHVYPDNPSAHTFRVNLEIQNPDPKGQIISLPAWIPGSYMIREFSKNIVNINATDDNGNKIHIERIDKHTWKLPPSDRKIIVTYSIYAWDLSVRMAHFDQNHGYFNGTSMFLEVEGQQLQKHFVHLHPPTDPLCVDWKISTALRKLEGSNHDFGWFYADDYDELIDHPVEMGTFEQINFIANDVPHEVVLTGRYKMNKERLLRDLKIICEAEINFFGGTAPMDRYVFQVMVVGNGYGGLEHRASTSLICTRESLPYSDEEPSDKYIQFLGLCSHEYFHTWNVKRIKPAIFTPYDLSKENYTTLLWVFEGWTSYYDDLFLIRNNLINQEQYLKLIAKTLTRVRKGNGLHKQSLSESSFTTWTKFYRQDENAPNAIVSYYAKGSLAALALDLHLRITTEGSVSLDHIMKELWHKYGSKNIGVPEKGVEELVLELSGLDLQEWFDKTIRGTGEIPLKENLSKFGILMHRRIANSSSEAVGSKPPNTKQSNSSMWVTYANATGGVKIKQVLDDGPAQQSGLSANDIIIAVDGLKATSANIEKLLCRYQPGETITVHAFRRDELFVRKVTLQTSPEYVHFLEWQENVTEEISIRRNSWLGIG
jgi:predicted metalloprotease with PDZ domain